MSNSKKKKNALAAAAAAELIINRECFAMRRLACEERSTDLRIVENRLKSRPENLSPCGINSAEASLRSPIYGTDYGARGVNGSTDTPMLMIEIYVLVRLNTSPM